MALAERCNEPEIPVRLRFTKRKNVPDRLSRPVPVPGQEPARGGVDAVVPVPPCGEDAFAHLGRGGVATPTLLRIERHAGKVLEQSALEPHDLRIVAIGKRRGQFAGAESRSGARKRERHDMGLLGRRSVRSVRNGFSQVVRTEVLAFGKRGPGACEWVVRGHDSGRHAKIPFAATLAKPPSMCKEKRRGPPGGLSTQST